MMDNLPGNPTKEKDEKNHPYVSFYFLENDNLKFSNSFWVANIEPGSFLSYESRGESSSIDYEISLDEQDSLNVYLYTTDIPLCYMENFDYEEGKIFQESNIDENARRFYRSIFESFFYGLVNKKEYLFLKKTLLYLLKCNEQSRKILKNIEQKKSIIFLNERDWIYENSRYPFENNLDCILFNLNSFVFLYRYLERLGEQEKIKYFFNNMKIKRLDFDKEYTIKNTKEGYVLETIQDLDKVYRKYEVDPKLVYASSHDLNYISTFDRIRKNKNHDLTSYTLFNLTIPRILRKILKNSDEKKDEKILFLYVKGIFYQDLEELLQRLEELFSTDISNIHVIKMDREYNETKIIFMEMKEIVKNGGEPLLKILLEDFKVRFHKRNEMKYFDYWIDSKDYYFDVSSVLEKILGESCYFEDTKIFKLTNSRII